MTKFFTTKRRFTAEERKAQKLRRHEHLRQIKQRYVHSDFWHGDFVHPGDATLRAWIEKLGPPKKSVLVAASDRHLKQLQRLGYGCVWHLEAKPSQEDILLGKVYRKPNATGPLERLAFTNPLDGAFVCERVQKQNNLQRYLVALRNAVKPGGPVGLVVPNAHHELVDDHVNLFTAGTLIYNLVRTGWNCRDAFVEWDGRFINVIVNRVDLSEPWPRTVDEAGPFTPFKNVFQFCSSEFPEIYRERLSNEPGAKWS